MEKMMNERFEASGLTSAEFFDFFAQYAEREANKILSARSQRNEKILKIINKVIPATAGVFCVAVGLIIPFI